MNEKLPHRRFAPRRAASRAFGGSSVRRRARGAAMLEAIIVLSTMLIFLGLIVWMRQAYGMKLDLQQKARSDTLYYASHACESGGDDAGRKSGGGSAPGADGPETRIAQKTGLPDAAAVNRSWNSTSTTLSGTVSGSAIWDTNAKGNRGEGIKYGRFALKTKVNAGSSVTCNEKKYDSRPTAWLGFGIDAVTSGSISGLF